MVYLSTLEIAKDLGLAKITVQKYCQKGFLPAKLELVKNNTTYLIESTEYLKWKSKHFSGLKRGQIKKSASQIRELSLEELREAMQIWLDWCRTGKLSGKPLGPRTIEIYDYYMGLYLKRLGKYPSKPLVSVENLRNVLGSYLPENYSTKRNIYDAVMSFTKYLIEISKFSTEVRQKLKELKPRRYLPAKKTSLTESQLQSLLGAAENLNSGDYERLINKVMIVFLANTGIRASEFCKLKLEDVDLESGRVFVRLGKGNKPREVGISSSTVEVLVQYLKARAKFNSEIFFLNRLGKAFTVNRLNKKISFIASKAGLKGISPHSLRRSFVTINAAKGRPLNHLRIACGHSDISTTQSYCMTSVDEVVEAMKEW